ncbi:MarR family transcriptional regulator [Hathewaya histolytica]|uniref:MarR family transcriptional regulator n=1 Tax=Hathewaya histolytica TaxID=1498 RepID=A0A4U9RPS5_HATHI|nr:MarR family transcriptional regulator [Hathewaya histolytica]VTQ93608.1 MarR family transcriptional regulator [Hathewaya histolytica]
MSFYKEESSIFYIYFQIIKKYKKYMEKLLADFELAPSEIDVLTFLVNNSDKNITASDISMCRGISKGLVSRAVHSLVIKKIIELKENPEDGRSVYLRIVDEEDNLIKEVKKINEKFKTQLVKGIDSKDFQIFLEINNKMLNNIKSIEIE